MGDRLADLFRFFDVCRTLGHGFVVRAMHDRWIDEDTQHLWEKLVAVPGHPYRPRRHAAQPRQPRQAKGPGGDAVDPGGDGRTAAGPQRSADPTRTAAAVWAVYRREEQPPAGQEAVEWMLLSSESAETLEQTETIIHYYTCRWFVKEFHRCLKEGCRIEQNSWTRRGTSCVWARS